MVITAVFISGCKDKGTGFIGTWNEVTKEQYPSTVVVNYDDGVYHVDVKYLDKKLEDKKHRLLRIICWENERVPFKFNGS